MNNRIFLVTSLPANADLSIEAGRADGIAHFDHHGVFGVDSDTPFGGNPAPCNDDRIVPTSGDIFITHMDADTYVGLLRMIGEPIPSGVDFDLMERIDLNGSSACQNKFDPTLLYMVGLGQWARSQKFPRPSQEGPVDVTELISRLVAIRPKELIELGRAATVESERTYNECLVEANGPVGLWAIGPNDPLDPSRPYEDGVPVVVVYRDHYKSISVYCSPTSPYSFGGRELAGILFSGHPKACGSPRGTEMTREDALSIFRAILEEVPNEA